MMCLLGMFDYTSCAEWARGENRHDLEDLIDELGVYFQGESIAPEPSQYDSAERKALTEFRTAFDAAIDQIDNNFEPRHVMESPKWIVAIAAARVAFLALFPWVSRRDQQ